MNGTDQADWSARLESEHENLRAALAWYRGDREGAESALRLAGALSRFWEIRGHYSEGRAYLSEALERAGADGRTQWRVKALNGAGVLAHNQGDYQTARTLYEESLAISRDLGNKQDCALPLHHLGLIAARRGDYKTAGTLHEESLAIWRELNNKLGIAWSLNSLGKTAYDRGDFDRARSLYEESLNLHRELKNKRGAAQSLEGLAAVLPAPAEAGKAVRLWSAAQALRESIGVPLPPHEQETRDRQVEQAHSVLGEEAFASAWEEGRTLTWEQQVYLP